MSVESARSMFHNVPNEVFDVWLTELISRLGWPFRSLNDSVVGTGWEQIFGSNFTMLKFASLSWSKQTIPFGELCLDQASDGATDVMLASFVGSGEALGSGFFPKSRERFLFQLRFMKDAGRLYAPLVLTASETGCKCIDGYHRLCALVALQNESFPVEHWLGVPNNALQRTAFGSR